MTNPPPKTPNAVRRKLRIASTLCLLFFAVELVFGYLSNSLAILSDAFHLFTDLSSFMVAIYASKLATRVLTPDERRSHNYGYKRAEVISALTSVSFLVIVTIGLLYESVRRIIQYTDGTMPIVDGKMMSIVAAFGIVINVALAIILGEDHVHTLGSSECGHDHGHGDLESGSASSFEEPDDWINLTDEQVRESFGGATHDHSHAADESHEACSHSPLHASGGGLFSSFLPINLLQGSSSSSSDGSSWSNKYESGGSLSRGEGVEKLDQLNESLLGNDTINSTERKRVASFDNDPTGRTVVPPKGDSSYDTSLNFPMIEKKSKGASLFESGNSHNHNHNYSHPHHQHKNVNLHAAYLHVLGDLLQSIAVFISGVIIYCKPSYQLADPICTIIFSFLVFYNTRSVFTSCLAILMEGSPDGGKLYDDLSTLIKGVPGVVGVHALRIHSITVGDVYMSAHVSLRGGFKKQEDVMRRIKSGCRGLGVSEITIQFNAAKGEEGCDEIANCLSCVSKEE
jgi:zinc transporter 2